MPDVAPADAVKVPVAMASAGRFPAHYVTANIALPYLGLKPGDPVEVFAPKAGYFRAVRLRRAGEHHAEYHPPHGPQAGTLRHAWHDRGDGVLIGFLKPTAAEVLPGTPGPSVAEEIKAPDNGQLVDSIRKAAADEGNGWLLDKIA